MGSSLENQLHVMNENSPADELQAGGSFSGNVVIDKIIEKFGSRVIIILILVAIGGVIELYSRYDDASSAIIIDNPTDRNIVVTIDHIDYPIEAGSYTGVSLPIGGGDYDVFLDDENVGSFHKQTRDGGWIVNPTMSMYIKERYIYSDDDDAESVALAKGDIEDVSLCIDGKEYDGGYNTIVYTGLYIPKDRDYGIDEDSPSTVYMSESTKYKTKNELFRKDQLIESYGTGWDSFSDC